MKKTLVLALVAAFAVTSLVGVAFAKKLPEQRKNFTIVPENTYLPPDLNGPQRASAQVDTFLLGNWPFDTPDSTGWLFVDKTQQVQAFFHVADVAGGPGLDELNGGTFGNLLPIGGSQSWWCGVVPDPASVNFCGYATLPGYGNDWDQILISAGSRGDSVEFQYDAFWDSEGGYDGTVVEYSFDAGATWSPFAVTDTSSARPGLYDNISEGPGTPPAISEALTASGPGPAGGENNVFLRFRFSADGAWSDEDGLWPTDGAIMVDNLRARYILSGATFLDTGVDDVEGGTPGSTTAGHWTGQAAPVAGNFHAMYIGISVLQEDPCTQVLLKYVQGWIDTPTNNPYACHLPNPEPTQGTMPYVNDEGIYLSNEMWSPLVANTGSGFQYRLRFQTYRDLPLDNLQFYVWSVRGWSNNGTILCPDQWRNFNFVYYGGQRDWITTNFGVGSIVDADAEFLQVAVGAVDQCGVWCNIFGTGACHSHAPLITNVGLERIDISSPQWTVRQLELFSDNFSEDGTLTGTARADAAQDILPTTSVTQILPGDTVAITVNPVADHAGANSGPAVYAYVNVDNRGPGKPVLTGAQMQSPDTRPVYGTRFPLVGTFTDMGGNVWQQFQMDTAITSAGGILEDRYCIDLNDALFVPGDTIRYYFGAAAPLGPTSYYTRSLNGQGGGTVLQDIEEAAASPMEFTILPAGGFNRGGDILMVDDTDDRGGPAQLFFDSALELFGELEKVDRYDVLGPSSAVGNSLASRAITAQIVQPYQKIIWNSGNLSSALIGDGTGNPEKSDDFTLLNNFLDTDTLPGLYISGDDIAEEWIGLLGAGAIALKGTYMNFNLSLGGDHIGAGEQVAPILTASPTSTIFTHAGVPDQLVAYGGCALINDFDVLSAEGLSVVEYPWPVTGASGGAAVISQTTPNSIASTARVVMSGFAYQYIRDAVVGFPNARTEFLRDVLLFLQNSPGNATGIDPGTGPQFANSLDNNYPNPFNPTTTIKYSIKERAHVSLKIYNAAGQLVKTLVNDVQSPDRIAPVRWDGRNDSGQTVSSGVYFYKLVTKNFSQTKKMVLLK
ncbi:MAG: T9SS type A sorting domain-containing protein [Candidatus Krumholzibacteria bacterium]|nr:T9SS type A sorting domain-containing protein [Candidatus Krumholzibacteria bacterium]